MHCKEVEKLMSGDTPFFTRYGITLIIIFFIIVGFIFWESCNSAKGIIDNILNEMIERLKIKI